MQHQIESLNDRINLNHIIFCIVNAINATPSIRSTVKAKNLTYMFVRTRTYWT